MMKRKVYLLHTDTRSLFTRVIKLYTKKPYNHVSISFDPQLLEVYSFGRKRPRNPLIGGFVKENIQTKIFKNADCAIYYCTVPEYKYKKMNDYVQEMYEQKDRYRYNLLGIFAIAFNKEIKRENAYFCSQFVATVLKECDIIEFNKPLSLVTPYDLQNSPHFQLFYQGSLDDYVCKTENERNVDMAASPTKRIRLLVAKIWSA
jgi:hypothetical protein